MTSKFLTLNGFNGSTVPRFQKWGIHPHNMTKGQMGESTVDNHLAPGMYDPKEPVCTGKKQELEGLRSDWRRALFLEQQGKIPHFMSKYLYKEKEEQKRKMGPGKYDHKSFIDDINQHNAAPSMQSKTCRFREKVPDSIPGPGTYGKGGIADQELYEANTRRKQCNTVGLLSRGGKGDRNFYHYPYSVGPGIYYIPNGIDETLQKRVGTRNRYDCDSEPRCGPIKYGHHATLPPHDLGPGEYKYKEFITELDDKFHNFKGKFLTEKQYPRVPRERIFYEDPSNAPVDKNYQVSPASYEPRYPQFRKCVSFGGKKHPFNLSTMRMDKVALSNFIGNRTPFTGPGRYRFERYDLKRNVRAAECSFKNQFLTFENDERYRSIKERTRPVNVLVDPEKQIDHLATEKSVCCFNEMVTKDNIRLH